MLPIPATLGSTGLESLIQGCTLAIGHNELQAVAAIWTSWIPVSRAQQARRVTILAEVIVPDQQVEAGLLLHMGTGKNMCRIQVAHLGASWHFLLNCKLG